jgi:LPXTG-motif cell wall-anchored protein
MNVTGKNPITTGRGRAGALASASTVLALAFIPLTAMPSMAAEGPVSLGDGSSYAVFGYNDVIGLGAPHINGNVAALAGTVTGLDATSVSGEIHSQDSTATAVSDGIDAAWDELYTRPVTDELDGELAGLTLDAGVYSADVLNLNGDVTLTGDQNSIFVFHTADDMQIHPDSNVILSGPIDQNNIFWMSEGGVTINPGAHVVGTVMAWQPVYAGPDAVVDGRLISEIDVVIDSATVTAVAAPSAPADPAGPTVPPVDPATPVDTTTPATPTDPATPADVTPAAATPAADKPAAQPAAADADTKARALAQTGQNLALPVSLGAILLAAGGLLVMFRRTRTAA